MPNQPPAVLIRGFVLLAALIALSACAKRPVVVAEDAVELPRAEPSAEAVQAVIEGYINSGDNRLPERLEAITRAVEADGKNSELRIALAQALYDADRSQEASTQLSIAERLGAPQWRRPMVALGYLRRHDAIQRYLAQLFATADCTGAPASFFQQWSSVAEGDGTEAHLEACDSWARAYPTDASASSCLGKIALEAGDREGALRHYKRAADLKSENAAASLMQVLTTGEVSAQEIAIAQEVADRFPDTTSVVVAFAMVQLGSGPSGEQAACERLSRVAARVSGKTERFDEMLVEIGLKERPELLLCFVNGALKTRGRNLQVVFASAMALDGAKLHDEALPLFERAVELSPADPLALNALGYNLADRGVRLEEAVSYLEKANRLMPDNAAIMDSLGWAYFHLRLYAKAEQWSRPAAEQRPYDVPILDHLADILWAGGNKDEAVSQWSAALEQAYNGDGGRDLMEAIAAKLLLAGPEGEQFVAEHRDAEGYWTFGTDDCDCGEGGDPYEEEEGSGLDPSVEPDPEPEPSEQPLP